MEKSLFGKVRCLEILEKPQTGKQRRIRPSSRDPREFKDFRDSRDPRDSSSDKTPFIVTPFPVPDRADPKKSILLILVCAFLCALGVVKTPLLVNHGFA